MAVLKQIVDYHNNTVKPKVKAIEAPYGVCSTGASTSTKTVNITGFRLVTGAHCYVKFNNANTATSPQLNVTSTGAKPIKLSGANVSAGAIAANTVYDFVYDGTNWNMLGVASGGGIQIISTQAEMSTFLVGGSDTSSAVLQTNVTVSQNCYEKHILGNGHILTLDGSKTVFATIIDNATIKIDDTTTMSGVTLRNCRVEFNFPESDRAYGIDGNGSVIRFDNCTIIMNKGTSVSHYCASGFINGTFIFDSCDIQMTNSSIDSNYDVNLAYDCDTIFSNCKINCNSYNTGRVNIVNRGMSQMTNNQITMSGNCSISHGETEGTSGGVFIGNSVKGNGKMRFGTIVGNSIYSNQITLLCPTVMTGNYISSATTIDGQNRKHIIEHNLYSTTFTTNSMGSGSLTSNNLKI